MSTAFWSKSTAFIVTSISVISVVVLLLSVSWVRNKKEKTEEETNLNIMLISLIAYPVTTLIVMINFLIVKLYINHFEIITLSWQFILLCTDISAVAALFVGLLSPKAAKDNTNRSPGSEWTIFYDNPEDPHLFVEKRSGLGWTLNFAHKKAYGILVLLGIFLLLIFTIPIMFGM